MHLLRTNDIFKSHYAQRFHFYENFIVFMLEDSHDFIEEKVKKKEKLPWECTKINNNRKLSFPII